MARIPTSYFPRLACLLPIEGWVHPMKKVSDAKDSHSLQIAEYTVLMGMDCKPRFNWWVQQTLMKHNVIIVLVKKCNARYLNIFVHVIDMWANCRQNVQMSQILQKLCCFATFCPKQTQNLPVEPVLGGESRTDPPSQR